MIPRLYWIETAAPGLAISSRPRGGDWLEDEIRGWRGQGVDAVVSLLTPSEADDLDLTQESRLAESEGIRFLSLPVEDRGIPSSWTEVESVLTRASDLRRQGQRVLIHCRQGIGRSGMLAAALLIQDGMTMDSAMQRIQEARGVPVPETDQQREWIRSFQQRMQAGRPATARASR
jgi:protein-tyrosine phosphatase